MTRYSGKPLLLVAATLFFSSAFPNPAPAQTVSFIDARRDFAVGTNPQSVAAGDFNGDGRPDLAVGNGRARSGARVLGYGVGAFLAARTFAAGTTPASVAAGGVNGHGR